jgi:DNA polymerase I-like protein with 3'-5' exonuclease and polymerase domains
MNKQLNRQLRKRLAQSEMKVAALENMYSEFYLFLNFMETNGVNVDELSKKFIESRKAQTVSE